MMPRSAPSRAALAFRLRTRMNGVVSRLRDTATVSPYRFVQVDPTAIEYWSDAITIEHGLAQRVGGAWDREPNLAPVAEHSITRTIEQRFGAGRDWADTDRVAYMRERLAEWGSFNNYGSEAEFLEMRCAYVDQLFTRIRDEGYRSNRVGGHDVPEQDVRHNRYRFFHRLEPLVVIGRDGGIHLSDGFHRVAIAAFLDIERIPVQVLNRHPGWLRTRDRFVADRGVENPEHPDLQYIEGLAG